MDGNAISTTYFSLLASVAYLRWQDSHTAVQGCSILFPLAWGIGHCLGHAANVALLGLHGGHIWVQPDDVAVCLQEALNTHEQQAAQDSSEGQIHTCSGSMHLVLAEQGVCWI